MKDGRVTITDWQKGQALSPFLGFATMRNCEVFDNPGIVKIAKQMEKAPFYTFAPQGMPIKRLKASNGDDYLLVTDILSGLTSTSLFKNQELKNLVEGKFVDALRSVAAEMDMEELHEKRVDFVQKVQQAVTEDLTKNGLELETVS